MKFSKKQRQLAFATALVATSICSVGLVSSVVSALAPGTPAAGAVSMEPSTGNSGTTFALTFASPQACPGDGPAGFQWTAFMTSASNDLAAVTFNASGSPATAAGFTTSLRNTTQTQVKAQFPGISDGLVTPPANLTFGSTFFNAVPAGDYWIAISCYKPDAGGINQTEKYWATKVTIATAAGAGPNNFTYAPASGSGTTTTTVAGATTTTTVAGATTTTVAGATTTTVAGATTTTVAGGTTTTTVAGGAAQAATLSPAVPTAGASYKVTHPNCRVGETITVTQPQSTPTSVTATCAAPAAGILRPAQAATVGTATVTFTAAPTTPGTYTVTSTGTVSGTRTATFVIVGVTSTTVSSSGGSPSGTSTGTIPATGSSTTSIIVWGILLLVFGRMAILFGRKPRVISAG